MTLAVLEGVAYALRGSLEAAKDNGIVLTHSKISGGGSKSESWKKIITNILNIPLVIPTIDEGPAFGAALPAMTANKEYESIEACVNACVKVDRIILPNKPLVDKYEEGHKTYKKLCPALRAVFKKIVSLY